MIGHCDGKLCSLCCIKYPDALTYTRSRVVKIDGLSVSRVKLIDTCSPTGSWLTPDDVAMLFRRGFSLLSFVVGFAFGVLFTFVYIVGLVCDHPLTSAGDIGRVLRGADGPESNGPHPTVIQEVGKSAEKQLKSDRKDTDTQNAANASVVQINETIAGCELVQKGIVRF